ncbi:hypothetical protein [Magnetospirillum fulvum]|uniref:Uncharacterized protein n=1 Tax=Magnetospirillum fulvum MGU-K5 TaxID=1316936 RepID=S9SFK2_MAGFU|nr:hypothetical protein [Magnetospirillum fulvum]EPY03519.1 hypothetical protein K678_00370 [Magnetospirillum fulvum MGU-K5]
MTTSQSDLKEVRINIFSESLASLQREACRLGYHEAAHLLAVARETVEFPREGGSALIKPTSAKSQEG